MSGGADRESSVRRDRADRMTGTAVVVEARKTFGSRVVLTTTAALVAGIAILAGALTAAGRGGNERVLDRLGPLAERTGWDLLLGVVAQITAPAALLGFGVVLSWMFGREFADRTVGALFALPVRRTALAAAKILVFLGWGAAVATALAALLLAAGLMIGLGSPDQGVLAALARQHLLALLSALLATPAAWVATLGRGPLPGIGATLGLIVAAQVVVVAGAGGWFPVAAPALWAIEPASVTPVQLALVTTVPLICAPATLLSWRRLQLDR
ncbi:ABC-2 type transport system permease protein [Prauserella shujinwangii]|uniref:ABC-2 type transport system permease protein n=1 Tax=Prauserella shujinwangii TaxID=1453103 RepID=A0A2T0M2N3_9PSEU|nr:ABC transporter permease [Prauserella shujinwangii]PRX51013.1 ABC-2 type transport system permease protein [Prauserella shujinwangii]